MGCRLNRHAASKGSGARQGLHHFKFWLHVHDRRGWGGAWSRVLPAMVCVRGMCTDGGGWDGTLAPLAKGGDGTEQLQGSARGGVPPRIISSQSCAAGRGVCGKQRAASTSAQTGGARRAALARANEAGDDDEHAAHTQWQMAGARQPQGLIGCPPTCNLLLGGRNDAAGGHNQQLSNRPTAIQPHRHARCGWGDHVDSSRRTRGRRKRWFQPRLPAAAAVRAREPA